VVVVDDGVAAFVDALGVPIGFGEPSAIVEVALVLV